MLKERQNKEDMKIAGVSKEEIGAMYYGGIGQGWPNHM